MSAESKVGDHETVEERYGAKVQAIQDAEMAWANACYTELEPGAEGEVLQAASLAAGDLEEAVQDFIHAIEKQREEERAAAHAAYLAQQAAGAPEGEER